MLTRFDDVFSPYARKVRIALYEKGVPFERVRAMHGDCDRTDFVHVNPRAEVPALIDGDAAIFDSTIICEYIEQRYPYSLADIAVAPHWFAAEMRAGRAFFPLAPDSQGAAG